MSGARSRAVAGAVAAAVFLVLVLLSGSPGISRDEARVLAPATSDVVAPLARELPRAADALLSYVGLSHLRAARAGTALAGALLTFLLFLHGRALAGGAAGLLAVALFWLAPRHLHAGLVATPDLAFAALSLAIVVAYRSAVRAETRRARLRAGLAAGLLFAAVLFVRGDGWILLPALALHAALARLLDRRRGGAVEVAPPAGAAAGRLSGAAVSLSAMTALGVAALVVGWPWVWSDPARRLVAVLAPGRAGGDRWLDLVAPLSRAVPSSYPLVVTALTVPLAMLAAYAGGLVHAAVRLAAAVRARRTDDGADELLLLVAALAPLAASAASLAPASGGVRPWLAAMPLLALLGARALVAAAASAWPARAAPLTAAVALLVLYPGLRATVHAHPHGASAWNELAGGAPGAASLALARQDGGEAAAAVLDAVNERARTGARIWWPTTTAQAVERYVRDGRLRADLALADGPDGADLAVVTLDGPSRDAEFQAWAALRTARPAAAAYLDEVPLVFVYARAGAWR